MKIFDELNNISAVRVAEGLGWLGGAEILSIGLASFYERSLHAFEVIFYPVIAWVILFFVQRKFKKWFPK